MAHILVVDDQAILLRLIARVLVSAGYQVTTSETADAAERELATGEFALVLCDLHLGSRSGRDVYETTLGSRPDVAARFIFMTGGDKNQADRAFLDAHRHIEKPMPPAQLLALVKTLIPE